MIDRRIGKIKVRRGTDLQRKQIVFEEGELIYTTDTKRVFVGDGITIGGIRVSNKNYITTVASIPNNGQYGDIIYVYTTKKTYIIGTNDGEDSLNPVLKLFLIADGNIGLDIAQRIEDLYTKLRGLTGCLTKQEPPPPPPVSDTFKWLIEPVSQQVNLGDAVTFTAKAIGPFTDIIYTWQKIDITGNYIDIPSKIGETFDIYSVALVDISYYRCVAKSQAGTIYSNPASLSIDSNILLAETGDFINTENGDYIEVS
jgi:hypothetical protein